MIRSTDLDSFVCCAVCSKIIPPPPSDTTFDRIREHKPFRTRYYTHRDILEIGASIQQEERERKEAEIQERIEKMKAELWSQAERYKEDAVDKALTEAAANYSVFVQDLKLKLEKEIREAVRKAKAEMKEYMEEEQRRETEATEQRMAHKLRCALLECAKEKMQAVAKARKQEREVALSEAAMQHRKHIEQLKEESLIAEELYRKTIEQLSGGKCNEMNIALSIKQKENQIEMEKQMKELETVHLDELEKVMITLKTAEDQVKALEQKLEKMRAWKDSLETEIQATRQAFQKYIDATFPNLSPGQADFILPLRTTFQPKDIPREAEDNVNECKRPSTESVRVTAMSKQHFK
uniref:Chromosome 6 open reading frame 163 n=1 Tax=Pavo cristatus TaxID=9049 RepID=A0A8C9EW68_PAVCR